MTDALWSYLLTHHFELWRPVAVNRHDALFRTLKISQSFERVRSVPVTNRICHRKHRGIIIEREAIPFGIDALTDRALHNHMVTTNTLSKTCRSALVPISLSTRLLMLQFRPHAILAEWVLRQMIHQVLQTASLHSKFFLPLREVGVRILHIAGNSVSIRVLTGPRLRKRLTRLS